MICDGSLLDASLSSWAFASFPVSVLSIYQFDLGIWPLTWGILEQTKMFLKEIKSFKKIKFALNESIK